MKKIFLLAVMLTACAPDQAETEAVPPVPEIKAPVLGVMHDPHSEAFCNFFPEGHKFDYNDLSTWKFVFTSPLDNSAGDGMAMIDGEIRSFRNVSGRKTSDGEVRHLRTLTAPFVEIEVVMSAVKDALIEGEYSESTGYTGTVRVIAPATGAPVKFYGDCGV